MEAYKILIQAKDKFSKQFSKATAGLKKIGGAAKSAAKVVGGLSLAVIAAATAFVALGKKSFDALDAIGKTADRTGIAAEKLQALRLGAVESGGSVEDLNKAIEKFAKNIGDVVVKGTGEASYALDRMGIQLRNNNGILKSTDQLLEEAVQGIGDLGSESERTSVLMALFGKPGLKLTQVLGRGAEGMAIFTQKAKEMGIIIDSKAISAVEAFNDRFTELKFMTDGLVNQTFAALAPGLEKIITAFKDWKVEVNKAEGGLKSMGEIISDKIVEAFAVLLETLGLVGEGVINFSLRTGRAITKLGIGLNVLSGDFASAQLALNELNKNPLELSTFSKTMDEAAASLRGFFEKGKPVVKVIKEIDDVTEEFVESINVGRESLEKFSGGFDLVFNNGVNKFEDMAKLGQKVGKTLEDGLTNAFMNIGAGAEQLKDLMDTILKQIMAELIRVFIVQAAVQGIKTAFGFPGKALGGPVTGGKTYLVGERGPELFTPPGNGNIIPNDQLGSGGGSTNVNISYNITAFDSQSATTAIAAQAPTIVGIVEQSFRKRGRVGPLGG